MAQALDHGSAREPESGLVRVVVDTPKGSRHKETYDETLGLYRLSTVVPVGITVPDDCGCMPSTRAQDGAPLDILVLGEDALLLGCLVPVRLVGVLQAAQTEHGKTVRNDRLMGAIETPVHRPALQTIADLRTERLDEIAHVCLAYNRLEGRHCPPLGRHGPAMAEQRRADGRRQCDHAKGGCHGEQHPAENDYRQ